MSRLEKFKKDIQKIDYSKLGQFWPVYLIIGIIVTPILLFALSSGFRAAIIGIVASVVEKLILSNLLVANLIIILILILLIILAAYIFKRL